jgi:hypothetical protein
VTDPIESRHPVEPNTDLQKNAIESSPDELFFQSAGAKPSSRSSAENSVLNLL